MSGAARKVEAPLLVQFLRELIRTGVQWFFCVKHRKCDTDPISHTQTISDSYLAGNLKKLF